jgi:hypothetical protein
MGDRPETRPVDGLENQPKPPVKILRLPLSFPALAMALAGQGK